MTVKYLAFPVDNIPCFGFAVCTDSGKLYLPEYNDYNTVYRFEETVFDVMCLYSYDKEFDINMGDGRTYAYMINSTNFIVGTMENIRSQLIQALDDIQDAPFSKLEIAEFINIDKQTLKSIQDECYSFLVGIDKTQANQWAMDNSYIPNIAFSSMTKEDKSFEARPNESDMEIYLSYFMLDKEGNATPKVFHQISRELFHNVMGIHKPPIYAEQWALGNSYIPNITFSSRTKKNESFIATPNDDYTDLYSRYLRVDKENNAPIPKVVYQVSRDLFRSVMNIHESKRQSASNQIAAIFTSQNIIDRGI